mmetsp:Transcript_32899/g.75728  ORF Transcript_32899/g.75728 Transcript_32899/m.75728 type:complete len:210 (+) Transcript_32899:3415-4044(+)
MISSVGGNKNEGLILLYSTFSSMTGEGGLEKNCCCKEVVFISSSLISWFSLVLWVISFSIFFSSCWISSSFWVKGVYTSSFSWSLFPPSSILSLSSSSLPCVTTSTISFLSLKSLWRPSRISPFSGEVRSLSSFRSDFPPTKVTSPPSLVVVSYTIFSDGPSLSSSLLFSLSPRWVMSIMESCVLILRTQSSIIAVAGPFVALESLTGF